MGVHEDHEQTDEVAASLRREQLIQRCNVPLLMNDQALDQITNSVCLSNISPGTRRPSFRLARYELGMHMAPWQIIRSPPPGFECGYKGQRMLPTPEFNADGPKIQDQCWSQWSS